MSSCSIFQSLSLVILAQLLLEKSMNSLFSLNGRPSFQPSNKVTTAQNRNKAVLFVMGVALTFSTALFARDFKPQDIQQPKEYTQNMLSVSSHLNLIVPTLSNENNDCQKHVSQKQKSKDVCRNKKSGKKSQSLVLNLKQLLEHAKSAEKNTIKVPKSKSSTTSMNELIETQKAHSQGAKIQQGEQTKGQKQIDIKNGPSIAQIPPFYITQQEIYQKRRNINSRKVNDWKIPQKNAIKEKRQLKKLQ